jgi:probable F420-dependent oxidoreductase
VATLDRLSGGRFLFGVGAGWNAEEMENHGTDFARRGRVLRERVEAMKEIWTKTHAEYHGEHVDFDPILAWPKPVQTPWPPIHVGGGWPVAARRAVAFGDGWAPIHGFGDLAAKLPAFRRLAADAGRDAADLEVTVFAVPAKTEALARYRDAGASRVVVSVPPAGRDAVLPMLDRAAEAARRL